MLEPLPEHADGFKNTVVIETEHGRVAYHNVRAVALFDRTRTETDHESGEVFPCPRIKFMAAQSSDFDLDGRFIIRREFGEPMYRVPERTENFIA